MDVIALPGDPEDRIATFESQGDLIAYRRNYQGYTTSIGRVDEVSTEPEVILEHFIPGGAYSGTLESFSSSQNYFYGRYYFSGIDITPPYQAVMVVDRQTNETNLHTDFPSHKFSAVSLADRDLLLAKTSGNPPEN